VEHRGQEGKFKRWETKREGGGGGWECWFKFSVRRKYPIYTCIFFKCYPSWTRSGRFGSISLKLWKPKPNRTENVLWFSNWLILFFFSVWFFSGFLGLISYSIFLLTSIGDKFCRDLNAFNEITNTWPSTTTLMRWVSYKIGKQSESSDG